MRWFDANRDATRCIKALHRRAACDSPDPMTRRRRSHPGEQRGLFTRALPLTVGGVIVAAFGGYAIVGTNGLLAWSDYRSQHDVAEARLTELEAERAALANRVRLLNPGGANADLADELARRELGVIRPDEVVLPIK